MSQSQKLRQGEKSIVRSIDGSNCQKGKWKKMALVSYTVESWYHKLWNPGTLFHGISPLGLLSLASYPMEYWYLISWSSGIIYRGIST